jgi:[acyl-carrier-protein] S-malonyltransferase
MHSMTAANDFASPNHHRVAFLFPGQGSQSVGMGRQLSETHPVARETFEEADDALGYKLSQLCWGGPEEKLKLTEVTQPAILTTSVAVLRVLAQQGIAPQFAAGHSLGEYSAHVAAGTLSFSDAVRMVRNRGRYMQEAVPVGCGAMAAILALPLVQVGEVCAEAANGQVCQPANVNSPDQVVISGDKAAVERAAELAKHRGAKRAVLLPVSAPFHCSLMQPAQERLAADLQALPLQDPKIPVMCNVEAKLVATADASRDTLVRQVTGTVQWEQCVRGLIASGVHLFLEVGPGKVLTGLMRQIDRRQTCLNVEDGASLEKLSAALAQR